MAIAGGHAVPSAAAQDSSPYEVPTRPSAPLSSGDVSINAAPAAGMPATRTPYAGVPTAYPAAESPTPAAPPPGAGIPTDYAPSPAAAGAPNAYVPPPTQAAPPPRNSATPLPAPTAPSSAAAPPPLPVPPPPPIPTPPAASAPDTTRPAADNGINQPEITRALTLRDLGIAGPMTLRGFSPIQGLDIPIPADEIVIRAQIMMDGALSPSLLPEASSLTVTLNEQHVGTIQVDPKNPRFGPVVFDIDPGFFSGLNHLNFLFAGEYRRDCNDMHNGVLWARVSDLSRIVITTVKLPPVRKLARLPAPFFDPHMRDVLKVPFIFQRTLGQNDLKAAGIVASWFGKLADFRGTSFPVSTAFPASGNGVEVGENLAIDNSGMGPSGPTLLEIPNPNDRWGTILVVTGRDAREVETAARVLAFSSDTLGDLSVRMVPRINLAPRVPYDAPAFIPTDRVVRFGDLLADTDLQHQGAAPLGIRVPFQIPPDLYSYRHQGFPVTLAIRSPAATSFAHEGARLDVLVNSDYVQSFPLFADTVWKRATTLLPGAPPPSDVLTVNSVLPPWMLFGGRNRLDLNFQVLPIDRGACRRVEEDFIAQVDSSSTFDFRHNYHYAKLPNLAYFAGSAFPFSRMADYSETAIVLPDRPDVGTLSAYLELMGFLGSSTLYPAVGVDVLSVSTMESQGHSKDIILLAPIDQLGAGQNLLAGSAYWIEGQTVRLSQKKLLDGIRYLFQEKDHAGQDINAQPVLNAPIHDASILVGAQSPYDTQRSVVAILGDHSPQLREMIAGLRDPQVLPAVQGDLVIKNGSSVTNYRNTALYSIGTVPQWIRVEMLLEDHILYLWIAGITGAALLTYGTGWWLRRHARARLRRNETGEDEPIGS